MRWLLKEPCRECPFRRKSAPGWLGPWTPRELLVYLNSNAFPCHKTIVSERPNDVDRQSACAGAAMFLNNKLAISRNRDMQRSQLMVKRFAKQLHSTVFSTDDEFLKHHLSIAPREHHD